MHVKFHLVREIVEVDRHSVIDVDGQKVNAARFVALLYHLNVLLIENHLVEARFVVDVLREMVFVDRFAHGSELHFVPYEIVKLQGIKPQGNVLDSHIQEATKKNKNQDPFRSEPQHFRKPEDKAALFA